ADYFFAAGALLGIKAKVKNLHGTSMHGDKKFLSLLELMGCKVADEADGLAVYGNKTPKGIAANMNDFSDQALTLAAMAPFLSEPTDISGIGHIRKQECDRINAMAVNLKAMGVTVEERTDGIKIYPCKEILPAKIETFNDHRVAMSFAIAGLKSGKLTIENPQCCKKTFENFFEILERL
ncbi:MAG: 3-phosphoshikimate 1-carboxyvinyltransferase, partial [Clostridia bacterium]|nr:3-phosphoshikimate 1-carboxyvinyltransferase [Clostridia bacterium]